MHDYHCQGISIPTIKVSKSLVHPVPDPEDEDPPSRFVVKHSTYARKTPVHEYIVKTEYQKYVSGNLTEETDILKYWEVRFILLDGAMTHTIAG